MVKFSTTGALMILTSLLAGPTASGALVRHTANAEADTGQAPARLATPEGSAQAAQLFVVTRDRPASATDICLGVILSGGLVALQLRRTQRGVRMSRLTV
jgi:hypothetical protein